MTDKRPRSPRLARSGSSPGRRTAPGVVRYGRRVVRLSVQVQHPRMPRLVSLLPVLLVLGTLVAVLAADPFASKPRRAVGHPDAGPLLPDVTYCTVGGAALTLDLFQAKPSYLGPRPLLVYAHGGGWTEGDKTWVDRIMSSGELALHGYTVAAVNYRLAPRHPWPAQVEDLKCAIRFLRAHSEEYNIDPGRIGVWGESAGGHLASMLGVTGPGDGFEGGGGYPEQSSRVQAVVDMFGPADLVAMSTEAPQNGFLGYMLLGREPTVAQLRLAGPLAYASSDDPPFLILHGEKDDLVPFSHSVAMRDSLIAAGVPVTLVPVRNASHVFVPRGGPVSPSGQEIKAIVTRFFDLYLDP